MQKLTYLCRLAFCMLLLPASLYTGWSQDQETTALGVLRLQAKASAEEFAEKLSIHQSAKLGLKIEGSANAEFTINVFLEVLQEKGFNIVSQGEEATLEILVLAQGIEYDDPSMGKWSRTARTAMEARLRTHSIGRLEYLGSSDRSKVDIVDNKENGWWLGGDALLADSSPGTFEKILIPITVIVATVLVVYLFFTVRN